MSICTCLWCRIDFPQTVLCGNKDCGWKNYSFWLNDFPPAAPSPLYSLYFAVSAVPLLCFSSAPLYTTSVVLLFIPRYQPELKFLVFVSSLPLRQFTPSALRQLLCNFPNLTCFFFIIYKFTSSRSTLCTALPLFSATFCSSGLSEEKTDLYEFVLKS